MPEALFELETQIIISEKLAYVGGESGDYPYPLMSIPTMLADIRFAIVPAIIALKPSLARS